MTVPGPPVGRGIGVQAGARTVRPPEYKRTFACT
ncbi:MAG: hypothetical protein QOF26_51 [Baekduia sp.]|jgi:hypothetical protein|nr:hypothetical protein [Baekduia sp.]MDX6699825.1 hypothetical protein [Baekduia sp.]